MLKIDFNNWSGYNATNNYNPFIPKVPVNPFTPEVPVNPFIPKVHVNNPFIPEVPVKMFPERLWKNKVGDSFERVNNNIPETKKFSPLDNLINLFNKYI